MLAASACWVDPSRGNAYKRLSDRFFSRRLSPQRRHARPRAQAPRSAPGRVKSITQATAPGCAHVEVASSHTDRDGSLTQTLPDEAASAERTKKSCLPPSAATTGPLRASAAARKATRLAPAPGSAHVEVASSLTDRDGSLTETYPDEAALAEPTKESCLAPSAATTGPLPSPHVVRKLKVSWRVIFAFSLTIGLIINHLLYARLEQEAAAFVEESGCLNVTGAADWDVLRRSAIASRDAKAALDHGSALPCCFLRLGNGYVDGLSTVVVPLHKGPWRSAVARRIEELQLPVHLFDFLLSLQWRVNCKRLPDDYLSEDLRDATLIPEMPGLLGGMQARRRPVIVYRGRWSVAAPTWDLPGGEHACTHSGGPPRGYPGGLSPTYGDPLGGSPGGSTLKPC